MNWQSYYEGSTEVVHRARQSSISLNHIFGNTDDEKDIQRVQVQKVIKDCLF